MPTQSASPLKPYELLLKILMWLFVFIVTLLPWEINYPADLFGAISGCGDCAIFAACHRRFDTDTDPAGGCLLVSIPVVAAEPGAALASKPGAKLV